jgi:hypothetical protein
MSKQWSITLLYDFLPSKRSHTKANQGQTNTGMSQMHSEKDSNPFLAVTFSLIQLKSQKKRRPIFQCN